ncbi:MAG: heme ABC exporter ATP-binding protein CcmA [Legionellales bacterium]|nr:MAG: heme ABC exporter ATP-binding protein CcmA [Legionellales bacterium]
MLKVTNVTCSRGRRQIFSNITFTAAAGELLLLVGANGSGKTSLLRILSGLLEIQAGSVSKLANQKFIYIGHSLGLHENLTVQENLQFLLQNNKISYSDNKIITALQKFSLTSIANALLHTLSQGQSRQVALVRLLLQPVKIWLLDEPFTALDAASKIILINMLQRHLANGGTIIMATHNIPDELTTITYREIQL